MGGVMDKIKDGMCPTQDDVDPHGNTCTRGKHMDKKTVGKCSNEHCHDGSEVCQKCGHRNLETPEDATKLVCKMCHIA